MRWRRRSWSERQQDSRDALVDAARGWTELAAAPASAWSTEVDGVNRRGQPVRVRVHVQYVPAGEEDDGA